jgi:exodeoxyribonuclease VII small subunit
VPTAPKATGHSGPGADPIAFEEALRKLEGIVEAMESEDLPLETLLQRYDEGVRLVTLCQSRLSEAEVKIQALEKSASGQFRLKPMPADAAAE